MILRAFSYFDVFQFLFVVKRAHKVTFWYIINLSTADKQLDCRAFCTYDIVSVLNSVDVDFIIEYLSVA